LKIYLKYTKNLFKYHLVCKVLSYILNYKFNNKDKMKNGIIKKIMSLTAITAIVMIALLNLSACKGLRNNTADLETFEVTRGDIVQTVSASGYIDSMQENNYSLSTSGKVIYTLAEGDKFKKGGMLLKIDDSRQELLVDQAEGNLDLSKDSLELSKLNYQQALDANHIAVQLADINTGLAEEATQSAYKALENANELAKASEESAYTALEHARNISSWLVESAKTAWDEAEKILAQAIADGTYTDTQIKQFEANANNAEANYEAVKAQQSANVDSTEGTYETTREQSGSSVDSARSAYEQSLLNQSSTSWTNLSSTENAESQIAITRKNIDQAETQLQLSEISLELAKMDLDDGTIYAPYDGIVLSSGYNDGEYASPGVPAISIISSDFVVKSEVSETDVVNLKVGQDVEITLDAYYEHKFNGKIIQISPISSNTGGVVTFEIIIELEPEDGPEILYGLSASLTITTSSVENILFVPIQSVYEEDGRLYVNVLTEDGKTDKKEVTTGTFNYDSIEIKSGLKEGDVVIISSI
jgi:RND family efflux transporter MFP subunit